MKISEIKKFPTEFGIYATNTQIYHESVLRSYQILEKVRSLLEIKTPPEVILEIIEEIESDKPTIKLIVK